jgi:hypothetical protein
MPKTNNGKSKEFKISIVALMISLAAILLSQLHPLYTYLDRPKLAAGVSAVQVFHTFGNLTLYAYLQLRNEGRATGTFTRVEAMVESVADSSFRRHLPVQTYMPVPTTLSVGQIPVQVPWAAVTLLPDASWNYYALLYAIPSKDQQARGSELLQEARAQIQAQWTLNPNFQGPRNVDDALFTKATEFTKENLSGFSAGEYYLFVLFYDEATSEPRIVKCYSFSVFEPDMKTFSLITEQFRTLTQGVQGFPVGLRPMTDPGVLAKLRKDFDSL